MSLLEIDIKGEGEGEPKMKRAKESETQGNEDRLSDLPDCVLLHILGFMKAKNAVRTCILSRRWKDLWKQLPTLILHSSEFWTFKKFSKFVSRVLSLRDGSIAVHNLDLVRSGCIEPHLLKRIVKYAISHNVQRLGISFQCDIDQLPPCFFSYQNLTSLKLSVHPRSYLKEKSLFPKSLSLAALTSLHVQHFVFCASDNDRAEPFSACNRLNTLFIDQCALSDAQILCISSTTLANLTMRSYASDFYKIVLSTPNLHSFAFTGIPFQQLSGSNLSFLQQVNIDTEACSSSLESPLILFSWLLELTNVKSLTVTSSTLEVLFLSPGLLKIELPCLGSLKSLKVKLIPTSPEPRSVAKLWKAKLKPSSPIPDGIVDFLLQNSSPAEVAIANCSSF